MSLITLRAHFDGERICLDEPFEITPETQLLITVLSAQPPKNDEQESWEALASHSLATAYDTAEPEYSLDLVKDPNPDYEGKS